MPLYQLILQPSPDSAPETLQFIAGDMPGALHFASRHTTAQPAELWSDGRRLCRLHYEPERDAWAVIQGAASVSARQRN